MTSRLIKICLILLCLWLAKQTSLVLYNTAEAYRLTPVNIQSYSEQYP